MKILVAEDDFTCRVLLQEILSEYGPVHLAMNGKEAVEAVQLAHEKGEPYDLVCLDIMMPETDGHTALRRIRTIEKFRKIDASDTVKIVMTTALKDRKNVLEAVKGKCDAYLGKPVRKKELLAKLQEFGLIK